MNFLKKLFNKKEDQIKSNADFWNWFLKHEKSFYNVVQSNGNIEKDFFNKISPKLEELKDGYYFLTGMVDDFTAELILTADGNPKNIVFVEELVAAAPTIKGWLFTALKPASVFEIQMAGYDFNESNMYFYSNEDNEYPDEINITIVHSDYSEENKSEIMQGCFIFLDNYLGELDFVNNIDETSFIGKKEAKSDLVPITKLKDFLKWRQKEFVEKYEDFKFNSEDDTFSLLRGSFNDGKEYIAVVNSAALNWESKASHPWVAVLRFKYDGSNNEGMPESEDVELFNVIEDELLEDLKDSEGYLNIGRQSGNSEREFYFVCKDFRLPSKVFHNYQKKYSNDFEIEYDIYKDKYWQSFERFNVY
jgi:Family of unknown function (DUF695)